MSSTSVFWVVAGFGAGIAACFVLLPILREMQDGGEHSRRRIWTGAVAAVGLLGLALAMYLDLGRPDALVAGIATDTASSHSATRAGASGQAASMDVSVQKLADKLASEGGTDAEWNLLAQSYDFLGNAPAAEEARNHRAAKTDPSLAELARALDGIESGEQAVPQNATDWLAMASLKRTQRDYAGAVAAYEQVRSLQGMTADAWADYADALASQPGGSLQGPAAAAIDEALKVDSRHPKALWLKATLALREQRYADAAKVWRELRAVLPAESPDARIIDANIAEATALLKGQSPAQPSARVASQPEVQVAGTVDLDPALRARLEAGMTLYVYARLPDERGPPLAVLRQPVGAWPVQFVLDDSLAMVPDRRLSDFRQVIIEARVSRSGQAIAEKGDLQGRSSTVNTNAAAAVTVKIDRVIS